jgi:hypothetical protein
MQRNCGARAKSSHRGRRGRCKRLQWLWRRLTCVFSPASTSSVPEVRSGSIGRGDWTVDVALLKAWIHQFPSRKNVGREHIVDFLEMRGLKLRVAALVGDRICSKVQNVPNDYVTHRTFLVGKDSYSKDPNGALLLLSFGGDSRARRGKVGGTSLMKRLYGIRKQGKCICGGLFVEHCGLPTALGSCWR